MTMNESTGYQRLHTEDNEFSPLASSLGPTQASSTHQRLPPHVVDNQSNAARVASLSAPLSLCRSRAPNVAWEGAVTFADEKLESLIQAIHDLDLEPHMQVDILFSTSGPPTYTPIITAIPFFLGNASAAEAAFAPILNMGPTSNGASELPFTEWGGFSASFCEQGKRKPVYGVSLTRQGLDPEIWRTVYDDFKSFVATYPEAANSSILAEYYPIQKQVAIGSATSSYPFRDIPIQVAMIPVYADSSLDVAANAYGSHARDLLRSTDGLARNST
ncbi:MAG: hypothetical protein Q9161_002333 [Pseudevernia consocians]